MKNKKILIIGGTGALGKTLTKRYYKDNKIIVLSRDEHKHVKMKRIYPDAKYCIGDVKDKDSLLQALNEHKPNVVINTAALKHVPICESNPYESVKTNIIGHKNLIDSVVMCNHQIETLKQIDIKVVLCRYGNVLESTGSVIPFFKNLLCDGAEYLPITDERMTRFSITLEESVDLIEWTYNHKDSHGSIVVPKLPSIKIVDLAKQLAKNYGKSALPLRFVGIRPGEKLHEDMVSFEESLRCVEYEKYFLITDKIMPETKDGYTYSSSDRVLSEEQVRDFLIEKGVI